MRVFRARHWPSHVLGYVDVDNKGRGGIEKWLDQSGSPDLHLAGFAADRLQEPIELPWMRAFSRRARQLVLACARSRPGRRGHRHRRGTGEILAMVSIPDYDPNNPREALDPTRVNRLTFGLYEMTRPSRRSRCDGPRFGKGHPRFPSSTRAGRYASANSPSMIFMRKNRVLSVPRDLHYFVQYRHGAHRNVHGREYHKRFLHKMGQLDRLQTECRESRKPTLAGALGRLNTVTIRLWGLAVSAADRRSWRSARS